MTKLSQVKVHLQAFCTYHVPHLGHVMIPEPVPFADEDREICLKAQKKIVTLSAAKVNNELDFK